MAADRDFYINIYGGVEYDDLSRLLLRAGNEINCFILRSPETEEEERQFDLAVCAQAEYMGLCGGVEAWCSVVSGGVSSFTVGSFSMSQGGASGSGAGGSSAGVCSRALAYLDKAGLLYRGCGVC